MKTSSTDINGSLQRKLRSLLRAARLLLMIGVGVPTMPAHAENYSGEWALVPCPSYSCGLGGPPIIQIYFCSMTVIDEYPNIKIQTAGDRPGLMTGGFTSPTRFEVGVVILADCVETYRLLGEFISPTEVTARFTTGYSGFVCSFTTCTNRVWDMTGTRMVTPCCTGSTGNVDCDLGNGIDISDLSRLVDFLYVSFDPLCCEPAADVDGQPGIDISDLSALVDYLYVNFTPPSPCP